tara:strand:- start:966 stop:1178 length:213 start_codon:yes stop_codon:yes gene_type:complete
LLNRGEQPEDLLGNDGSMKELKVKLIEQMLGTELTTRQSYEAGKDHRLTSQTAQWLPERLKRRVVCRRIA